MLNGEPVIRVRMLGRERHLIVDTGSSISLVQPGIWSSKLTRTNVTPFGVTGDGLNILGEQLLTLEVGDWRYSHRFCVCSLPTQTDGIIGLDMLESLGAHVDLENRQLLLLDAAEHRRSSLTMGADREQAADIRASLIVFSNSDKSGTENRRVKTTGADATIATTSEDPLGSNNEDKDEGKWLVRTTEEIRLAREPNNW
jgi:hypothetical protein